MENQSGGVDENTELKLTDKPSTTNKGVVSPREMSDDGPDKDKEIPNLV
jgi:hypothetical protein